jgi:hypothetical protein
MARKQIIVTDMRVREACEGTGVQCQTATPRERFEAYMQWTFGDATWARVVLDVARNCGYTVKD